MTITFNRLTGQLEATNFEGKEYAWFKSWVTEQPYVKIASDNSIIIAVSGSKDRLQDFVDDYNLPLNELI